MARDRKCRYSAVAIWRDGSCTTRELFAGDLTEARDTLRDIYQDNDHAVVLSVGSQADGVALDVMATFSKRGQPYYRRKHGNS